MVVVARAMMAAMLPRPQPGIDIWLGAAERRGEVRHFASKNRARRQEAGPRRRLDPVARFTFSFLGMVDYTDSIIFY
jgi:hypothetical protein